MRVEHLEILGQICVLPIFLTEFFLKSSTYYLSIKKIVQSPVTHSKILEKIANLNTIEIQKNIYTKSKIIYNHFTIQSCIAKNENTPLTILRDLAKNESSVIIKKNLTSNHNLTQDIIETLVDDSNETVRYELIKNPNISLPMLQKLARDDCSKIAQLASTKLTNNQKKQDAVISYYDRKISQDYSIKNIIKESCNNNIEKALQEIINLGEIQKKFFLAQCHDLPISFLEQLAHESKPEIQEAVAKNPNTPNDILLKLAFSDKDEVRLAVAQNTNSDRYILEQLAYDQTVQEVVAKNTNTPETILSELASSEIWEVRLAVAQNPNSDWYTLEKLFHDRKSIICESVISNPNFPKTSVEQILCSKDALKYLKYNPNFLKNNPDSLTVLLDYYARSQEQIVSYIALLQPEVSQTILLEQSGSVIWLNRFAVAQNPTTSLEILERLTEDCNQLVRAAAKENSEKRKGAMENQSL